MMTVDILGCGSATPSLRHQPSSQVVEFRQKLFMIDCGEGAQLQMMKMRLNMGRLNNIFISHLHGDHLLGLPGLLSTMALHEKGAAVTLHIFEEGAELIGNMLRFIIGDTPFDIKFNIIDPHRVQLLYEDKGMTVRSFPLYHRVPAVGFRFDEKPGLRHIRPDMLQFHRVPVECIKDIKAGADFVNGDGQVIANSLLTTEPTETASYAYCCDTMFDRRVLPPIRGVKALYHDSTYGDDCAHLAAKRGHSTARQAGEMARRAGCQTLVLGHFSKRYKDETPLAHEASEEFDGQIITANEGMRITL